LKHLFIVNPVAGGIRNKHDKVVSDIEAFAKSQCRSFEIYITKVPMDACKKIIAEAESGDDIRVYACGGDGTLNECANGAANRANVAITHYPCGTGNDFIKTFGIENVDKFRNLQALTNGEQHPLDLIQCGERYGINIASVGIDARIGTDVHKYSKIPLIGGATGYVVSLIINVIKGVTQKFSIKLDDISFDKKITLACACNGRFYGGGFNPVPTAMPDDGLLDCLIVEPVSRLKVAEIVGKYAKGMFSEFPDIFTHRRAKEINISCDKEFVIQVDGEALYAKAITFKLIPKGINFIFPQNLSYFEAKA